MQHWTPTERAARRRAPHDATDTPRACASRAPIPDLLAVLALVLMLGVAGAGPAGAGPSLMTSECEDGSTVCWIERDAEEPADAAVEAGAGPDPTLGGAAEVAAVGGVLSLSNADVGLTRGDLATRLEAPEAATPPSDPPAPAVEPTQDGATPPDQPVLLPSTREEVWTSVGAAGEVERTGGAAPHDFDSCMERSIRAGAGFAAAGVVCEALFPQPAPE